MQKNEVDSQGLAEVKAVVLHCRNSVAMVETLTPLQVPHVLCAVSLQDIL